MLPGDRQQLRRVDLLDIAGLPGRDSVPCLAWPV